MNIAAILLDTFLILSATALILALLGALSRRLLGVRMSAGRIILAGALGLGAGVGFESQFVWRAADYTPALLPVLFGIIAKHRLFTVKLGPGSGQTSAEQRTHALALKGALEEAGGAFVKLGQLLSTRADVLPPEFIAALGDLQHQVPPAPWEEIEPALERTFGSHPREAFAEFSETPFAAASIGQVHAATLLSGEQVAVKVRRPGIVQMVERDIDIAQRLARRLTRSNDWAARFGVEPLVESLTTSLREELDYTREAANIAALAEVQTQVHADAQVRIPRFFADFSSEQVLVMELVSGVTLAGASSDMLDAESRRLLAHRLLAATLAQIMEAGVFHSDLHPGNIIIGAQGDLVLLDFGSIGRIDSDTRSRLGEVLFAFSRRDAGAFTDALFAFVDLSDVGDETGLRRDVASFMTRRLGSGARLNATMFSEVVSILADHGLRVPAELTVPFRAIATVEGSLTLLDPAFDFVEEAGGYAQARLHEATRPASIAQAFTDELLSALPVVKRLPHRIDRMTGSLADGRFGMNVRMLADPRDRNFLREIIGLVVISFLAGIFGIMAAMLLTSNTGPMLTDTLTLFQVFGYLFLLIAGVLTLRALFDVLRRRPAQ